MMASVTTECALPEIAQEEHEEMDEDEVEEDEEVEDEEEVEEEDEEEEGIAPGCITGTVGRKTGRGLTLQTLLEEKILEPGQGNMTINYLGNRFRGDLLADGRIRSQETGKIFGTPSAWAIFCKKIVNPDKKSGCGWASVRYRGKKLDVYKNNWFRQKRIEFEKEEEMEEESGCESEHSPPDPEVVEFDTLSMKGANPVHDAGTMVELSTFQSLGRIQPFNITMSSSAMAVIDVHAHISSSEVCGYLAGQWDVNNHNLIVSHAFPVRCRLGDTDGGPHAEKEVFGEMARLKLSLVGWYHSHPYNPPLPSLRDIDAQLDYQMKMKGYNDASYTPVLGIIVAPYQKSPIHTKGLPHRIGNATGYWVHPPPEAKPTEYGRPMSMQFTLVQDAFIPKEALLHMSEVLKFYKGCRDAIVFADSFEDKVCYWHKLKASLQGRVPKDHFQPLIDFLTKLIDEKLPEDLLLPLPCSSPPQSSNSASITEVVASRPLLPISDDRLSPRAKDPKVIDTSVTLGKDLETCVSNIIKSSISSLNFDSLYNPTESYFNKDKTTTTNLSPAGSSYKDYAADKSDEQRSTPPKSSDGKTTPPKPYSPLFNIPPPPLFSMDSKAPSAAKDLKESFKDLYPLMGLNYSESTSKSLDFSSGKDSFPSASKSDAKPPAYVNTLLNPTPLGERSKRDDKTDQENSVQMLSPFMNLAPSKDAVKQGKTDAGKSENSQFQNEKVAVSKKSWFSHAKMLQEAFSLPPHERDNPFMRDPQSSALHREILQDALKDTPEGVRELFKDPMAPKEESDSAKGVGSKELGIASGQSPITNAPLFSHWNPALMFDREALKSNFPPPPPYPLHSGIDVAKSTTSYIQAQANLPPTGFSFSLEAPSKTKDSPKPEPASSEGENLMMKTVVPLKEPLISEEESKASLKGDFRDDTSLNQMEDAGRPTSLDLLQMAEDQSSRLENVLPPYQELMEMRAQGSYPQASSESPQQMDYN